MSLSIGIVGGVGAIASARFHLDLVQAWAKTHNAQTDDDFPTIIHISYPLGLSATGMRDSLSSVRRLMPMFRKMEDCDVHAVICNSITPLFRDDVDSNWTPVRACREALRGVNRAWLLASDSTIADEVYQRAYPHIEWLLPKVSMTPMIQQSLSSGQVELSLDIPAEDTIVLGCTELSTAHLKRPNTISPTDEMIRILCAL